MTRSPIVLIALAVASVAIPAPLLAETEQVTVTYADLDLSTEPGQAELKRRLGKAIEQVCFEEIQVGSRISSSERRMCAHKAKKTADERFAAIMAKYSKGG